MTPPNLTLVEDPACGAKGRDYSAPLLTKEGMGEVFQPLILMLTLD